MRMKLIVAVQVALAEVWCRPVARASADRDRTAKLDRNARHRELARRGRRASASRDARRAAAPHLLR